MLHWAASRLVDHDRGRHTGYIGVSQQPYGARKSPFRYNTLFTAALFAVHRCESRSVRGTGRATFILTDKMPGCTNPASTQHLSACCQEAQKIKGRVTPMKPTLLPGAALLSIAACEHPQQLRHTPIMRRYEYCCPTIKSKWYWVRDEKYISLNEGQTWHSLPYELTQDEISNIGYQRPPCVDGYRLVAVEISGNHLCLGPNNSQLLPRSL